MDEELLEMWLRSNAPWSTRAAGDAYRPPPVSELWREAASRRYALRALVLLCVELSALLILT